MFNIGVCNNIYLYYTRGTSLFVLRQYFIIYCLSLSLLNINVFQLQHTMHMLQPYTLKVKKFALASHQDCKKQQANHDENDRRTPLDTGTRRGIISSVTAWAGLHYITCDKNRHKYLITVWDTSHSISLIRRFQYHPLLASITTEVVKRNDWSSYWT